jgi:hypothetical protein
VSFIFFPSPSFQSVGEKFAASGASVGSDDEVAHAADLFPVAVYFHSFTGASFIHATPFVRARVCLRSPPFLPSFSAAQFHSFFFFTCV